jgi:hypothetical protein
MSSPRVLWKADNRVIRMSKHDTRKSRNPMIGKGGLSELLEILLAFDQAVVESSMNLYNVHERDRVVIREQNRRLHAAMRKRPCQPFVSTADIFRRPKYRRAKYRRLSA